MIEMFELVPSAWMRNYFEEKNRVFTDWEKAALIWNAPARLWSEKINALKELAEMIDDESLKKQIAERVQYEEKACQLLLDNVERKFVYVVIDEDGSSCGYFADFERARTYAVNYANRYASRCQITKQLIIEDDTADDSSWLGTENARVKLNADGEIMNLYSNEMPDEEKKIENQWKNRFEGHFFKIPFGMEKGTIVRMFDDGMYAVLAQGEGDWNQYMDGIPDRNLYADYSDIQVVVYVLKKDGHWSHEHINPMYLEPCELQETEGGKREKLLVNALRALRRYFQEESEENGQLVIKASREYADECGKEINWGRVVYEAERVEDILW